MAGILVVDDSKMMRRNLKKLLTEAGHEVVAEADNGSEAVSAFGQFKPELVTMDINMPVMDGIEAVRRILVDFPEAIIVMISAHNEQNRVYQAIKCGAKNYIVKPVRADKLLMVIDQVLKQSQPADKTG
ncbi:response regulator [candidate division GN15 bacterium]|nr:response regulator [candidate division GN15 bacterium]